jgi:preprotein translocase subunit SecG
MYIFISVLILLVSILLGLIVLVQNPKGGGLAANFTGSTSQFMGVRQTADFLEKASWSLAIALLVLSLVSTTIVPRAVVSNELQDTEIRDQIEDVNQNPPIDYEQPPARDNEGGE